MLPYLRKFDETPYHRNEAQVMATAYVTDSTSISAHAQYVSTDYIDSPAGLLWDKRYSYGADFTYALTDRLNVFADAGLERVRSQQAGRQWQPNLIPNPYVGETGLESDSNWTASPYDDYWSAGLGFQADLVQQRLSLNLQYNFSKSDGRHSYTSPLGTAATFDRTPSCQRLSTTWTTSGGRPSIRSSSTATTRGCRSRPGITTRNTGSTISATGDSPTRRSLRRASPFSWGGIFRPPTRRMYSSSD